MLKVLIVDNEQFVRAYLQNLVNWEQYDCQVVTTCETEMEALEVIKQQSIDLILIKMSKMYGLKLIEEIKVRGYQTKVIVLSHQNNYDLIYREMENGTFVYYVKMDPKEEIISIIQQVSREIEKQLSKDFKIKRKNFIMKLLKEKIYDDELELLHAVKLYHLFEPQLSLYQLRFQHPIESRELLFVTKVIESQLKKYDYDVIFLKQEVILIILYERVIHLDQVLLDDLFHIVKAIQANFKIELQVSKRFVIDSVLGLMSYLQRFRYKESFVISTEECLYYRLEIQSILTYIHEHYDERITLQDLSTVACLNEAYLSRLFKIQIKKTINSYINELRIYKAKELLKSPNILVKEVAQSVGINDQLYFNRVFKKFCGESPTEYQDRVKKIHN